MSAAGNIRTGHWIDHTHGTVLGSRVTLTNRDAGFLIAFIALFNALVGTMIWNILTFLLFSCLNKDRKPHDGLHAQAQALLRNSNEPLSFARHAFLTGWAWRKTVPRALLRTVPLSLLAISVSVLSATAGIYSSQIAITSGDVLLLGGETCGVWKYSTTDPTDLDRQTTRQAALSSNYADSCYTNPFSSRSGSASTTSDADCEFYTRPLLNFTAETNNPCPFADATVCSVPISEVVQLSSAMMDSSYDLGINQPAENRVSLQRILTCSPLTVKGFSTDSFYPIDGVAPNVELSNNYSAYSYGKSLSSFLEGNITFLYSQTAYEASNVAYAIDVASTLAGTVSYVPVPRLTMDSSLPFTLVFLANRQQYVSEAVDDPWFAATTSAGEFAGGYGTTEFVYVSSVPGRVIGCVEQAQFCNPANNQCSDLNSWWFKYTSNSSAFGSLGMNAVQRTTAFHIANTLTSASIWNMFTYLGADLLDAQQQLATLASPISGYPLPSNSLPSNQWQIEVGRWMAASNAMLQRLTVDRITGGPVIDVSNTGISLYNSSTVDGILCASQRVKSTAYQSFSVLGLALNFALGGVIATTAFIISCLRPAMQKHRSRPNRLWISTGLLQIQRMAYEELGAGDWEVNDDNYPVTKGCQFFRIPLVGPRMQNNANSSHAMLLETQDSKYAATETPLISGVLDPLR